MAQRTTLEARLRALLSTTRRRGSLTRRSTVCAAVLAACLLLPLAAVRSTAQGGSATLFGTVYDISGAVVPNARVNLTNLDGKNRELTTAGAAGEFRFNGIPGGHYLIEVRQPGFELFKSNSVEVQNGATVQADVRLQLGGVNEAVDVVADTPRPAQMKPQSGPPKRIRVGGSVQATKLVNMVRPLYPEVAKQTGVEGSVLIRAVISVSGDLLNAEVVSTSNSDLATAALDAVKQWKYQPTLLNGEPVEVITTIAVNFKLKN